MTAVFNLALKTSAKVNNDKNRNNQSQVLAANKMIHG